MSISSTSSHALETFLSSEYRDSSVPWQWAPAARPFITISREAGSGGSSLARMLVRRLNAETLEGPPWRVFEGNIVTAMLAEKNLPSWTARFLGERKTPEFRSWFGEFVGLHPNIPSLLEATHQTMARLAATGNVIFVGRGANYATASVPGGIHVRLMAPAEQRAKYLAKHYDISEREAFDYNRRCDAERRAYVRQNFGENDADASAYDLIINTGKVSLPDACGVVCSHLRASVVKK